MELVGFDCLQDASAAESALFKLLRQTSKWPTGQYASDADTATGTSAEHDVPQTLHLKVRRELRQGESLRWLGRPETTINFLKGLWSPSGFAFLPVFGSLLLIFAALLFIGVGLSFSLAAPTGVGAPGHCLCSDQLAGHDRGGAGTCGKFSAGPLTAMKIDYGAVYFHQPLAKDCGGKHWSGFEDLADSKRCTACS